METKNKRSFLERVRRQLYFSNFSYVDPVGASGGLALWWTDEVDLQIRAQSQNAFRCIIKLNGAASSWLATFVYAPPRWPERRAFWTTLQKIATENEYPWLCLGDLNETGWSWEKQGSQGGNRNRMQLFQELLADCDLMDLEFKGAPYTWTNNLEGDVNVRERLDKAMATVEWRQMFPYAQVIHEALIGSDRCPLLLHCVVPPKRVPRIFKFENMRMTHPDCE